MSLIGRRQTRLALGWPGRPMYECSVGLSAVALLFPAASILAAAMALWARSRGAGRWRAALAAAAWCGLLGAVLRMGLALPVAP